MTGVFIRREDRETHRGEGYVNTEAEIGGMLPQAKEQRRPPEGGRNMEAFFPRGFRGGLALRTP